MKITKDGKQSNAEFTFKIKHCHVAVSLHVEIEPEALIFEPQALQDSSETMNKICTDVAQSVAGLTLPLIGKFHSECLQALERSELEIHQSSIEPLVK